MPETKTIASMTDRQRSLLANEDFVAIVRS
jgi:hypothetical protein